MSEKLTSTSNKVGRPKENMSRVSDSERRPRRANVGGFRNVLDVEGKDPAYEYRWVSDTHEKGQRILKMIAKDYDFVKADSVKVGEGHVFSTEADGSIVRIPAGGEGENFLYLMRIHKDWYDEDQKAKQEDINAKESDMIRDTGKTEGNDELYGSVKIDRN